MRALVAVLVAVAAGLLVAPGALGYNKKPTAKPPVKPADVAFFNAGRACVRQVGKAFDLLDRASRQGKFNVYVAGATSLKNRGARCVTRLGATSPGTKRGRAAKAPLIRAMRQHRNAGVKFELAASAQKRGDRNEAIALTNQAARHLKKAKTLTRRSNRLIRGVIQP